MRKSAMKTVSNRMVGKLEVHKDTVFWDKELTGFGVRVYPTGSKVYIAQARGPAGPRRVTVGRHGVIHSEEARRRAALLIARIKAGGEAVPVRSAGGPTVAELAGRYMAEHVEVRCKPRTAAAVRAALRVLSSMFETAGDWGLLPEGTNPCRAIVKYPLRRRERFLTEAEFMRLGKTLDEIEAGGGASACAVAAIRLLTLTGCRKSEVLGLRWEDVALGESELRLADSKTGARVVSLPPAAAGLLAALPRLPGNPWVFPGRKPGARLSGLDHVWRKVLVRAELDDVRIHDLRHSYASRALALGEGLSVIAKLLGHSHIQTTARYAHLARDTVREAAERVAASIAADLLDGR